MKKIIIPISALFVVSLSHAQSTNLSTNENYVYSKTYLSDPALPNPKSVETVQYIDGLGRPKQVVNVKASPLGRDVVTHIEYDGFGRQVKDYLPVPQPNTLNGAIVPNPLANATQPEIYGSEKIYAEKILENSPLDRIQQQIQLGNDWTGKPVKFDYDANKNEDYVRKYKTTTTWVEGRTHTAVELFEDFLPNQLYKNTVTDEDGNKTIEFKNGQGQTLLIRKVLSATENADTYYVYNEYNQLAYVIPPLASAPSVVPATVENLYYQYRYDGRNRLVEKKIPGKGWEYMVYDKADRLIMTQDANLQLQQQWLITKYDRFGRVSYTGIIQGGSRENMQSQAGNIVITEARNDTGFTRNGMQIYYSNGYFLDIHTVLSVNYYDTYPTGSPAAPTQVLGQNVLTQDAQNSTISTKSLPVASYVKNIEDDNWTKNYTWYDIKGRPVGSHSINHLGGYTKTESELDFSGTPKQVITRHKRLNTDTERVITENFTYDHQNRLLVHTHQVDNNPVEYLAQNEYNPLSQLKTKKVGGVSSSTPLQTVDYQYNIRGWMTKINDPVNLGTDFFGYKMKYTNPEYNAVGSGRYNGNIAEIDWNMSTVNSQKRYTYAYDGLNRLSDAVYTEPDQTDPNTFYYNENLTYDKNGNIKTLKRFAYPEVGSTIALKVDDLDYQYEGNRLTQVIETSLNIGYEGGNGIMDYDNNGNMTAMPDKGLFNMRYNHLNLPSKMSIFQPYNPAFGSYDMNYLYRADGVKLRKKFTSVPERSGNVTTKITDYLDGFHYNQTQVTTPCMFCPVEFAYEERAYRKVAPQPIGLESAFALDFVGTSEGFFSFKENRYIYQYRDHLGNARVSYAKKTDGTVEITDTNDYYAFGLNHIGGVNKGYLGSYYNYKYNGKEIQETGMYDYGARFYMPDIGRWGVMDPLAEINRRFTPYNYAINNPLRFIDPDGRSEQDWVKRTGQSNWEYRSDITSAQQASDEGFVSYANGRGDKNSSYTTSLSQNGVDTGIIQTITLGEGGNWSASVGGNVVDSGTARDSYTNMKPVDDFGKFMAGFVAFPMLLEGSPFLVSGGSAEVLGGKATLSAATQFLGTGDVNIMSVVGDTFGAYGSGEVFGGVSELSAKKLINGESAFRTVFNGSMSPQEATSNIGIALGSKGLGKLNGATKVGATGAGKAVVGVNNFLIGTGMYGAAAANATEIQKKQK